MATLPQLIEEDIQRLEGILQELLTQSDLTSALIIDKGGFLITHRGESNDFDLTTIAALASGAYLANQTIANLIQEENFDSVYQQGEKFSMFALNIDEHCLLVLIFRAAVSVGAVKYFALRASPRIAAQIKIAHERDPNNGVDLSILNLADTRQVFRKKKKTA
jgi:predicted regulator of Ras-like GTPase activity (Roadblock/LC7/MglB family)